MDLNALLFQHQVALMRGPPQAPAPGSRFDLVGHYGRRLEQLRQGLGVCQYPSLAGQTAR